MTAEGILGIDTGLFISEVGLAITAISAVVGIWIDRDTERPVRYSIWLTSLVVLATGVGVFQSYSDYLSGEKVKGDIARILEKVDKIAHEGKADVPALNQVLKEEVAAQTRNEPDVARAMAQRVTDGGGDPKTVLGGYLSEAEIAALAAKGELITAQMDAKVAAAAGHKEPPPRQPVTFGTGKAQLRGVGDKADKPQTEKKP